MSPLAARRTDHAGAGTPQSAAGYAPAAPRHEEDKGLPSDPDPDWEGPVCRKAPESFDAGLFRRNCRSGHGPLSTLPGIRAPGTAEGWPGHCRQERCVPAKEPRLVPRHLGSGDQGTGELLDASVAGKAESRMFGSSRNLRVET